MNLRTVGVFILLDALRNEPVTAEDVSLHTIIFATGWKLIREKR